MPFFVPLAGPALPPLDSHAPPAHVRVDAPATCQPHDRIPDPAKATETGGTISVPGLEAEHTERLAGVARLRTGPGPEDATTALTLQGGFVVSGLSFQCAEHGMDHVLDLRNPGGERVSLYTQVKQAAPGPGNQALFVENFVWSKGGWEHRHRLITPSTGASVTLPTNNPCMSGEAAWQGDYLLAWSDLSSDGTRICIFDAAGSLKHQVHLTTTAWAAPFGSQDVFWSDLTYVPGPTPVLVHHNKMSCLREAIDLTDATHHTSSTVPGKGPFECVFPEIDPASPF